MNEIKDKFISLKGTPYLFPACVITILGISTLLILALSALYAFIIPIVALLVPLKLFNISSVKKIFIMGAVSIIVIALVVAGLQIYFVYSRTPGNLGSEYLTDGTVDELYGDTETTFYFTVDVTGELPENYTVYLNFTFPGEGFDPEYIEGNEMESLPDDNRTYYVEKELDRNPINHFFAIRMEDNNETLWNTTEPGFGPVILSISYFGTFMFLRLSTAPFLLFLLILSLLWWKQRLEDSKITSTSGLDEKEKELEDSCPKCGTLLKGADECPECDWERSDIDKKLAERERKKSIVCPNCDEATYSDSEACEHCGWEL